MCRLHLNQSRPRFRHSYNFNIFFDHFLHQFVHQKGHNMLSHHRFFPLLSTQRPRLLILFPSFLHFRPGIIIVIELSLCSKFLNDFTKLILQLLISLHLRRAHPNILVYCIFSIRSHKRLLWLWTEVGVYGAMPYSELGVRHDSSNRRYLFHESFRLFCGWWHYINPFLLSRWWDGTSGYGLYLFRRLSLLSRWWDRLPDNSRSFNHLRRLLNCKRQISTLFWGRSRHFWRSSYSPPNYRAFDSGRACCD